MRKRFEPQLKIGQLLIKDTIINHKCRDSVVDLMAALKFIFVTEEYNVEVFNILENAITSQKKSTGRKGMDLWQVFVLSQVRLCLNTSYDRLHHMVNNDRLVRQIMGIENKEGYKRIEFEYQNIYDNVTLLDDHTVKKLNNVIIAMGHDVFKKKEEAALRLKTDSFVVESNVHFPTDYNLLWDCARKCLDTVSKFLAKYNNLKGWRKVSDWRYGLKGLMRELGKSSSSGGKGKQDRIVLATKRYLKKARLFQLKLQQELPLLPLNDLEDLRLIYILEHFIPLLDKHIDLVDRRILKNEKIPHEEKLFSIFETYTEWINKGKSRPNIELGKKLAITTDQFGLIVDYQVMHGQQDRDIVIEVADRLLPLYSIASWSFDKGYWLKRNKELLQTEVPKVIMPKLGKRTKTEEDEETSPTFKRLKNKHSAIESNINELEHRGLDRCPDRGLPHFERYISLGVCAYNLKKIGREILKLQRNKIQAPVLRPSQVA
ncbi:ISNCY family transposase [bacterium]|nr:ISNCY family transposase [bacterium]